MPRIPASDRLDLLRQPRVGVCRSHSANSLITGLVKTAVVGTMAGQGGGELGDLKGLTVPVRLSGPFDQLKYKVEFSQMVRGASKEQLEAAAKAGREALKGNAREKLQELLGGKGQDAPAQPEGADQAQQAAPKKSKDQLKDALKGLLR